MIEGASVKLRPVHADDLSRMRRWFDNPETMWFWAIPRPFVTSVQFESDLDSRFARFDQAGYFTILGPDDIPIGRIDFDDLDPINRSASIGILIGDPAARGKGYGPDAIIALLRYLFLDRNLHRVELTVLTWNERAVRAYRRIGFVDEGVHRDHRFAQGVYHDERQMSMLRPEFDARYGTESLLGAEIDDQSGPAEHNPVKPGRGK
jgi:RimJ/RimL family protein N-acetyltransferase